MKKFFRIVQHQCYEERFIGSLDSIKNINETEMKIIKNSFKMAYENYKQTIIKQSYFKIISKTVIRAFRKSIEFLQSEEQNMDISSIYGFIARMYAIKEFCSFMATLQTKN